MTDLTSLSLGRRIAYLRRQQALTQEALAERLNISAQAVSKWENDLSCPDIMTLPPLAALLGVTTDTLLTGAPSSPASAATVTKKPEELVVCLQISSDDGTVFRCNLPYKAFRIGTKFSLIFVSYKTSAGDDDILSHMDFTEIIRRIEGGMRGTVYECTEDGETISIRVE